MIQFEGNPIVIKNGHLIVGKRLFPVFQEKHSNILFSLDTIKSFNFDTPVNNKQGIYLFVVNKDFLFPVFIFSALGQGTSKLNKKTKIKPLSLILLKKNQIFYVGSDNEVLTRARQHIVDKKNSNSSLKLSMFSRKWIKKYLSLYIVPYICSDLISRTKLESQIRETYIPVYSNK